MSLRYAHRAGFTLIELLLALAIAVLVAALAWSILFTTSDTVERQQEAARGPQAAARALDRMVEDLTHLFLPVGDDACALALRAAGDEPFELSFCRMQADGSTRELAWTEPRAIVYRVGDADSFTAALVRVSTTLSGVERTETNVLVERVESLRVEFSDGIAWHAAWPPPEGGDLKPRVARVAVQIQGGGDPVSVECWLPAGHVETSRIIRTTAPGS